MMVRGIAAAALLLTLSAAAEPRPYRSSPDRRIVTQERDWGQWIGPYRARLVPVLMQDFGERYLYRAANAALPPPRLGEERVVFLGDSITDGWSLADAFPGKPYVNRGISGQVTAQMLLRFQQDVVALRPRAVVILGGTNDVQGVLQQETSEGIVSNIATMGELARANGIHVVLCALLPVNNYTENARDMLVDRPPAVLADINARLRSLAAKRGYRFADYDTPMRDGRGMLIAEYTTDGLHPNAAGYARMAPIVRAAIAEALKTPPLTAERTERQRGGSRATARSPDRTQRPRASMRSTGTNPPADAGGRFRCSPSRVRR